MKYQPCFHSCEKSCEGRPKSYLTLLLAYVYAYAHHFQCDDPGYVILVLHNQVMPPAQCCSSLLYMYHVHEEYTVYDTTIRAWDTSYKSVHCTRTSILLTLWQREGHRVAGRGVRQKQSQIIYMHI